MQRICTLNIRSVFFRACVTFILIMVSESILTNCGLTNSGKQVVYKTPLGVNIVQTGDNTLIYVGSDSQGSVYPALQDLPGGHKSYNIKLTVSLGSKITIIFDSLSWQVNNKLSPHVGKLTISKPVHVSGKWLMQNGTRPCSPLGWDKDCGSTEINILTPVIGVSELVFMRSGPHCVGGAQLCMSSPSEWLTVTVSNE